MYGDPRIEKDRREKELEGTGIVPNHKSLIDYHNLLLMSLNTGYYSVRKTSVLKSLSVSSGA